MRWHMSSEMRMWLNPIWLSMAITSVAVAAGFLLMAFFADPWQARICLAIGAVLCGACGAWYWRNRWEAL